MVFKARRNEIRHERTAEIDIHKLHAPAVSREEASRYQEHGQEAELKNYPGRVSTPFAFARSSCLWYNTGIDISLHLKAPALTEFSNSPLGAGIQ